MRLAPSLAWTALVLFLGSIYFGADHTRVLLLPILRALAPVTGMPVHELHTVVRKAAHVTEYAVLAALWFRALAWRRGAVTASWLALCLCLTCAVIDEAHQALVPNRTGSARDVVIDATGAVVALGIVRRRRELRPTG
jgi:VanZ family protein